MYVNVTLAFPQSQGDCQCCSNWACKKDCYKTKFMIFLWHLLQWFFFFSQLLSWTQLSWWYFSSHFSVILWKLLKWFWILWNFVNYCFVLLTIVVVSNSGQFLLIHFYMFSLSFQSKKGDEFFFMIFLGFQVWISLSLQIQLSIVFLCSQVGTSDLHVLGGAISF